MLDVVTRRLLAGPLDALAAGLDHPGINATRLTLTGLALALASAGASALQWWVAALLLWLTSRLADGLDGPLARRHPDPTAATGAGAAGGYLDIVADFTAYGLTVAGVAWGASAAYGASLWPFLLVLLVYYVNGAGVLAWSSIAERLGQRRDDGRSLSFPPGFAGATETIVVHSLWLIVPAAAAQIALIWAVVVGLNAARQAVAGYRSLS